MYFVPFVVLLQIVVCTCTTSLLNNRASKPRCPTHDSTSLWCCVEERDSDRTYYCWTQPDPHALERLCATSDAWELQCCSRPDVCDLETTTATIYTDSYIISLRTASLTARVYVMMTIPNILRMGTKSKREELSRHNTIGETDYLPRPPCYQT
ncbi:hypothetical protein EJ05DRAFT_279673 [Pseudovirgaria hyperparasitica]|uniref:Uncharacterized protein n=1 Tax=Pseudovirgaria hyperparasitica TaxID=470096 RepID=A0A6A6WFG3_9PEZI|nr:uncharacterized protein EJ05DRAFT_279673 [Pseudovirgaria hyperparasitica]KAF2760327.1 hypothetical protein EJ05DRAFT_279673 [Pseudovirgaria hyperparasitica]